MSRIKIMALTSVLALGLPFTPVQAANFGLFSDITANDSTANGDNPKFALGALDFYGTHAISRNTRIFFEYVFENADGGLVTDLERLWISRRFNNFFTLAAGRFHTPLGYWNRAYHHGAILQDTVSRPFFLDYEDGAAGILPLHVVGLMASGNIEAGNGLFRYEMSLANGPSLDTSGSGFNATQHNKPEIEVNDATDPNRDKSVSLRITYEPDDLPFKSGVFAMRNVVAESSGGGGSTVAARGADLVTQLVYGADLYSAAGNFDLLGEFYRINNDNKVAPSGSQAGKYSATAYYLQLGYQVTNSLKAIVRYADLSFNGNDSYFKLLGTREATHKLVALRYDLDDTNSIKMEVRKASMNGGEDITYYNVQWAFLVP